MQNVFWKIKRVFLVQYVFLRSNLLVPGCLGIVFFSDWLLGCLTREISPPNESIGDNFTQLIIHSKPEQL